MTTYTETDLRFIDGMRAAVADRGSDWRYPTYDGTNEEWFQSDHETCVYSLPSGEPACLIGKALSKANMGVPEPQAEDACILLMDDYRVSEFVADAASQAQAAQDTGATWGKALEVFERYLP